MTTKFSPRWFVSAAALFALAGCAQMQTAGTAMNTWMHNYARGRYHATPSQMQLAQERAAHHYSHLSAAKKKESQQSEHRYLAVRTLDPSPGQLAEIKRKAATGGYGAAPGSSYGMRRHTPSPPPPSVPRDEEWHCVVIWDTWSKQVVGNDCYAVTEVPAVGQTARFDTYSAEYIGSGG